jgi:superfamily I DNA/RNA helicase
MNWMCSFLDQYTLVSNSDAHSPEKLGRNANLFKTGLSYPYITDALKTGDPENFGGTIDMFPQEGKYHYDGHRKCGLRWSPVETLKHRGICPVCGKKVTVGVTNRVVELSDRKDISNKKNQLPFHSIIPLKEMLSEIEGVGEKSKKITKLYDTLIKKAGSEFNILHFSPIDEVKATCGELLAEGIRRMRNHEVIIKEGFDGEYGQIKVFKPDELKYIGSQESLFNATDQFKKTEKRKLINFDLAEYRKLEELYKTQPMVEEQQESYNQTHKITLQGLNPDQVAATNHFEGTAAVMAGPGTGKTKVLTHRIAHLINEKRVNPQEILAITFTNKAAEEIQYRCDQLLKNNQTENNPFISTFHAFGYYFLKQYKSSFINQSFSVIDEEEKRELISETFNCSKKQAKSYSLKFKTIKQEFQSPKDIEETEIKEAFQLYEHILEKNRLVDLEDLIYQSAKILSEQPELQEKLAKEHRWILVDEFQDINYLQYQLLQFITAGATNPNLFIIGDPNQAIYGFRGSSTRFISRFITDYSQTTIYKLNTSYRCSNNILKASGDILQEDGLTGLSEGVKIKIAPQRSEQSEAEYIARTIEQLSGGLRFFSMDSQVTQGNEDKEIESLSDFAILCRTKSQMKCIEKALLDHTIPFQSISEDEFFKNHYIRTARDIIALSENPENSYLYKKLGKLRTFSRQLDLHISHIQKIKSLKEKLDYIQDQIKDDIQPGEGIQQKIKDFACNYSSTLEFLKKLSLGTGNDLYEKQTEQVTVMTLHASKGLEFKCVFIAGCENGIIPYSIYKNQETDTEEEKRLLYVGMTRAQKYLYITHSKKRTINGQENVMTRSPFLNRIEKELTETEKNTYRKKQKDDSQLKLF